MSEITDDDRKFDRLTEEYWERFHKSYGIVWGDSRPLSYHNSVMEEALSTGVPVEIEAPDPDPDIDI